MHAQNDSNENNVLGTIFAESLEQARTDHPNKHSVNHKAREFWHSKVKLFTCNPPKRQQVYCHHFSKRSFEKPLTQETASESISLMFVQLPQENGKP